MTEPDSSQRCTVRGQEGTDVQDNSSNNVHHRLVKSQNVLRAILGPLGGTQNSTG